MLFSEKILKLENGSQYVLRSPRREDAAAMLRYLQQTSAETHFLIRTPEEAESDVQSEEEFLAQAEKASRDVMIAAFSDGRVLGVSAISCVSDRSKMRHRASLAIALLREAWGSGLAAALLSEMIALAPSLGYTQLELGVFSDNERAIRLYSRFGFQEWGRTKNAFRLGDGTCFDEILMGLQLTESEMDSANPGRPEGSSGISTIERMNEEHAVLRNFGLPLLTWKSGMRILDAGCGGGKTIEEMLRLSPDSVIDGIDFSETSVQKARELNRAELGSRVHVVHGDVGSLPYEDGTFDLVTAVETVYFWPDILGSLREIRRVLKKGGCAEILNEGSDPSILEVWPHIDGFMKVYRPEELKELMELAGFSKVRIERGEDQLVAAIAVK